MPRKPGKTRTKKADAKKGSSESPKASVAGAQKRDAKAFRKSLKEKGAARAALNMVGRRLELQKSFQHNAGMDFSEQEATYASLQKEYEKNTLKKDRDRNYDFVDFQRRAEEALHAVDEPVISRLQAKLIRMVSSTNMNADDLQEAFDDAMSRMPNTHRVIGALNGLLKDMRAAGGEDPAEARQSNLHPVLTGGNRRRRS